MDAGEADAFAGFGIGGVLGGFRAAEQGEFAEQVVQRGDDGVSKVRFIMKDNGRGPELNESYRYAADGSLLQFVAV